MPPRTIYKSKDYKPRPFICCDVCGQEFYAGFKEKHESSQRHVWCLNAILKFKSNLFLKSEDLKINLSV